MEHYYLIHIPFEIGSVRIFKLSGNREQAFEKMKRIVLNEFGEKVNLDGLLESNWYKVNKESGIIYRHDHEYKLIAESEIINH